uniref:Myb-like DNA-binding domain-containing protein n=1 Tax=Trepomonas sp. PC1 TaxID=1076344 RepID=A0A146KBK5_9EUKA|eukprot:JAP93304.1 Myb-like DNA-binding domain-containing protein [Trepomonas sp. PC1]
MKWSNEDKEQLIAAAKQFTSKGRISWQDVSQVVKKTPNQCKTMYTVQLHLKDFTSVQKWTDEEIFKLFQLVEQQGKQWSKIQKNHFPNRTKEQIRQKYLVQEKYINDMNSAMNLITHHGDADLPGKMVQMPDIDRIAIDLGKLSKDLQTGQNQKMPKFENVQGEKAMIIHDAKKNKLDMTMEQTLMELNQILGQ